MAHAACTPGMRERKFGRIINVTCPANMLNPGFALRPAKSGLEAWSRSLAGGN